MTTIATRYPLRGRLRLFTVRDGVERRGGWRVFSRRFALAAQPGGDPDASRDLASLQLVAHWPPRPDVSLRMSAGGRWSETPWDAHASIGGVGAYLGVACGGRIAERLTRLGWCEGDGKYTGRHVFLHTGGGSGPLERVYWSLWTHPQQWTRGRFPRWRDGSAALDPREWLWGPARWDYTPVDAATVALRDPEDERWAEVTDALSYPVTFVLRRAMLARPRQSRPLKAEWEVEWECRPDGIPVHLEADGSWKGSEVVASGLRLSDAEATDPHWPDAAAAHLAVWIVKTRSEHRR